LRPHHLVDLSRQPAVQNGAHLQKGIKGS
jgi:hypothetical protein